MSLNSPTTLSTTLRERSLRLIPLSSVEWAQHVALIVERQLRTIDDPAERARLKQARDWHYATLADELIDPHGTIAAA